MEDCCQVGGGDEDGGVNTGESNGTQPDRDRRVEGGDGVRRRPSWHPEAGPVGAGCRAGGGEEDGGVNAGESYGTRPDGDWRVVGGDWCALRPRIRIVRDERTKGLSMNVLITT